MELINIHKRIETIVFLFMTIDSFFISQYSITWKIEIIVLICRNHFHLMSEFLRITANPRATSNPLRFTISANSRAVSIPVATLLSSRPFLSSNEHDANKKALGMQAFQGFVFASCSQITLISC